MTRVALLASRHGSASLEESGAIVGFHGIARDGDDFELAWLFVAPEAMGRGIGAALLADACPRSHALPVAPR